MTCGRRATATGLRPCGTEAVAPLAASRGAEAPGDLVEGGEHLGRFQVQEGQGAYGGPQFAHGDGRPQSTAHHVADDQGRAVAGELDHVEPVAADLGGRVAREVATGDVQARGLGVTRGSRLRWRMSARSCSRR